MDQPLCGSCTGGMVRFRDRNGVERSVRRTDKGDKWTAWTLTGGFGCRSCSRAEEKDGGRERGLSEECRGRSGYNLTSSNLSFLSKLLSIDRRLFFKMTGQTPRLIFLVGET